MNRIQLSLDRMRQAIAEKSPEQLANLERIMQFGQEEYVALQELKSLAQANGTITYDEACTVFRLLGSSPDDMNKRSLAERCVLVKLGHELELAALQRRKA